jgi:hypothetical protein
MSSGISIPSARRTDWFLAVLAALVSVVGSLLVAGPASAATPAFGYDAVTYTYDVPARSSSPSAAVPYVRGPRAGPEVASWERSASTRGCCVAAETAARAACFVAGTQVLMADGTRKAIEDVKVGDKVASRNVTTGKDETHTVTRTFVHHDVVLYEVKVDGGKVTTTADHPFYVHGLGWTAVKDLRPGDELDRADGTTVTVEAVIATGRTATVYNFEVEGVHDYYVQAGTHWVLVHNDCLLGQAVSVADRYGASAVEGGYSFPTRQAARQAASELAGDLGSNPTILRKSDFRGGPWSWKNSTGRIGVERSDGAAGWRDDVLGHDFGDSVVGPHVNVWRGGQDLHLFYPGVG